MAVFMKNYPEIWDLQNAKHFNSLCLSRAWIDIGEYMNRSGMYVLLFLNFNKLITLFCNTVEECKAAWKSIRDSRRYFMNASRKKRSGSVGGEPIEAPEVGDNVLLDWELGDDLSYLPDISKKRK